ncbi:hypothetical protein TNCV_280441 [Trichonephila clavipes]|nr:hypothetical protein TNCV_280441 [Trichonephila clavipes]
MKTAGWSKRRVAGQVDRSECAVKNYWEQWTREGTHARKTGLERPRRPREERRSRRTEVDMSLRRFRRQYEQWSQVERGESSA